MKVSKMLGSIMGFLIVAACIRAALGTGPFRLEPLLDELRSLEFSLDTYYEFIDQLTLKNIDSYAQELVSIKQQIDSLGDVIFFPVRVFFSGFRYLLDLLFMYWKCLFAILKDVFGLIMWILRFVGSVFGLYVPDSNYRGGR